MKQYNKVSGNSILSPPYSNSRSVISRLDARITQECGLSTPLVPSHGDLYSAQCGDSRTMSHKDSEIYENKNYCSCGHCTFFMQPSICKDFEEHFLYTYVIIITNVFSASTLYLIHIRAHVLFTCKCNVRLRFDS